MEGKMFNTKWVLLVEKRGTEALNTMPERECVCLFEES